MPPSLELLAPAGDPEKLQAAFDYGADAVYLGAERFGLRALAGNFSLEQLRWGRDHARERGKRLYLTLNAYLKPEEMGQFASFLEELRPLDLDAYILSDPGVLSLVREVDPKRPIHLSTQANTTNAHAARLWQSLGAGRVNLARELTLEQVRSIRKGTDVELEIFVHGALCVAYSGRCLLSSALTGRSANAGACAHPCRWKYALAEETRPGEWMPVEQDGRGSYVFNSRDLCLIDRIGEIAAAGVDSLKIEGRMKSVYYVAAVTRVYRAAIDSYLADPEGFRPDPRWREELEKVSHRPFGEGFLFPDGSAQVHADDSLYRRTTDFVGVVRSVDGTGRGTVQGRNRFLPGDELELIGPGMRQERFACGALSGEQGNPLAAAQPNLMVVMDLPAGASPGDILRREKI